MSVQTITPQALQALVISGKAVELIDVRTAAEFAAVHAASARLMPLDQLDPAAIKAGRTNGDPVYFICKGGTRSANACRRLAESGFPNVVNVEGGTTAWVAAGLPVVRDPSAPQVIPLERQLQITMGVLALVGAGLGWLVHPGFFGVCALVGAGLIVSGMTGCCAVGLLLARMPWNRGNSSTCMSR